VQTICDSVKNNDIIVAYGDYDADGLMSIQIVKNAFDLIGYNNIRYYHYICRTHSVDKGLLSLSIMSQAKLVIVMDSGTGSLSLLKNLTTRGMKVIIIDHHDNLDLGFSDFEDAGIILVNSEMDHRINDVDIEVCGAALVYGIINEFMGNNTDYDPNKFACLALIAMYADTVNMNTTFAKDLYMKARNRKALPHCVNMFMDKKQDFTKRFCEFTFSPKVNAAFRMEKFDIINNLFFGNDRNKESVYLNYIKQNHLKCKELAGELAEDVECQEYENLVLVNLSSLLKQKIYTTFIMNNKGLIANKICEKYSKAVFCVCNSGTGIVGSFRDLANRDVLQYMAPLFDAGGHASAFGFVLRYDEWHFFLRVLDIINRELGSATVAKYKLADVPMYKGINANWAYNLAFDNEFSSRNNPIKIFKMYFQSAKEYVFENAFSYGVYDDSGSNLVFITSNNRLYFPSVQFVKPYLGLGVKYEVVPKEFTKLL